jgi:hypothetical protein
MRMPKAARVAFGGEMRFVPSMAQVHLLSPSGSFLRERPLQKHVPTVGHRGAPWRGHHRYSLQSHQFRIRTPNGTKL